MRMNEFFGGLRETEIERKGCGKEGKFGSHDGTYYNIIYTYNSTKVLLDLLVVKEFWI